jgi:hypothetical protein
MGKAGSILGRLPKDDGKVLRCGGGLTVVISSEVCEGWNCDCQNQSTIWIQGETDSFGYEVIALCDSCYEKSKNGDDEYFAATDVEDREAAPGKVFLIDEGTNIDSHHDWQQQFKSWRKAVAFYRQIENTAAAYAGLYPKNGIKEVPAQVAEKRRSDRQDRIARELADEFAAEAQFSYDRELYPDLATAAVELGTSEEELFANRARAAEKAGVRPEQLRLCRPDDNA